MGKGYFTQPSLSENRIIFVCEDDLWEVASEGGQARRLTNSRSEIRTPVIDPSGQWIACCAKEEGDPDADNDGIVDAFDDDDDNDGIDDVDDMDDDNDGIDDVNDRCPGTTVDDPVDHEGCSASQIIGEISEDEGLPGFSAILAVSSILGLAILRKPRI